MSRSRISGIFLDQSGNTVNDGTITINDANTSTASTIYSSSGASTAITGSAVNSTSNGYFFAWVDTDDYAPIQKFDLQLSKTGFKTQTYQDIIPFQHFDNIIDAKRDYGATGDGVTDDTSAIQNAINAAYGSAPHTSGGNNIVFLPTGVYVITSALTITEGIWLKGSGNGRALNSSNWDYGATRIKNTGTANNAITISVSTGTSPLVGLKISDIDIEGAGTGATSGHGISFAGLESGGSLAQINLVNVSSYGHKQDGYHLEGATFLFEMDNCISSENFGAGLQTVAIGASVPGQLRVRGGMYYGNTLSNILLTGAGFIRLFGGSYSNNGSALATTYGIEVASGSGGRLETYGIFCEGNDGGGDMLLAGSQPAYISGCNLVSNGTDNIKITSHANIINGLYVAGTNQITVDATYNFNYIQNRQSTTKVIDSGNFTIIEYGRYKTELAISPLSDTGTAIGFGQYMEVKVATTEITSMAGASETWANAIPIGTMILGVTSFVTTAIGNGNGTTGYQVGDGTDVDRWGQRNAITQGSITDGANFTIASPVYYTGATSIVITAVGGNFDGTGDIRLAVYYIDFLPANS